MTSTTIPLSEVAQRLHISHRSAAKLARERHIPAFKLRPGGWWYMAVDDLDRVAHGKATGGPVDDLGAALLAALANGPSTLKELRLGTRASIHQARRVMAALLAQGKVTSTRGSDTGRPLVYRLAQ